MFIGGYISAAGLGLTCPEWPLCPNGLLPNDEFLVEWIHRFVAATTSVLVAVTAVFSWRSPNSNSKIRFTSAFACGLIVVQISLGALVIDTLQSKSCSKIYAPDVRFAHIYAECKQCGK